MKPRFSYPILLSLLLSLHPVRSLAADAAKPAPASPTTREETVLLTVTASVEAIDHATREVTLKGPLGNQVTFTVDPQVKRLNEVKVGDLVQADYFISIAAELRPPTAQEQKEPLVLLEGAGKAPPGTSPSAGALRRFKVVTTVEGLDRSANTVTVKGPRGRYVTARVANPALFKEVRLGDTIVVTYTEALAVSLEKVTKKHAH